MKLEGTVYRLVPFKMARLSNLQPVAGGDQGFVDIAKSLKLFSDTYIWGGADRSDVYFDEKNRQNFIPYRLNAARVSDELVALGRKEEAIRVLDKVNKGISETSYSYDFTGLYMAQAYYHAGGIQQASKMARKVVDNARDDIRYAGTLSESGRESMANESQRDIQIMAQMAMETIRSGDNATTDYIIKNLQSVANNPAVSSGTIHQVIQELQSMQKMPQQVTMPAQ